MPLCNEELIDMTDELPDTRLMRKMSGVHQRYNISIQIICGGDDLCSKEMSKKRYLKIYSMN